MRKLLIFSLLFAAVIVLLGKDKLSNVIRKEVVEPARLELSEILERDSNLPEPLRLDHIIQPSHLSVGGVITLTNEERAKAGLPKLLKNAELTRAAEAKVDDMFAKQYFEHESPDGKGPSDLATASGYEYILVGENLAFGNFTDDAALVLGWMNSPGHRENILNSKYQEIGVSVKQGIFQGKKTWLAVQEFGTPLSSCPGVNLSIKAKIDANQDTIAQLEVTANAKRQELDQANGRAEYNKKVDEYNAIANQINALVAETKELVATYNQQVNAFNKCVES